LHPCFIESFEIKVAMSINKCCVHSESLIIMKA